MTLRYAITLALFGALALQSGPVSASGDDGQAAQPSAETMTLVYKSKPRRTLTVYYPDDWKATDRRSALVIFRCRIPAQREHFRKLGMVIIKPQLAGVNSGQLPKLSLDEIASLMRIHLG